MKKNIIYLLIGIGMYGFTSCKKISESDSAGGPSAAGAAALTAAPALTFNPTKDATVKFAVPTTNFGTALFIHASAEAGQEKRTYLQFTVSGLPTGATGISAQLKITVDSGSSGQAVTLYRVSDNAWDESTIVWNNKPAMGTAISTVSNHTSGSASVWDVSAYVTGNGTYAIGMNSAYSGNTSFNSRESTTPPELVVTYNTGDGTWIWGMAGIHGGGMGQVIATDPFNVNYATVGGDSWGIYNTTNAGNKWYAATKGLGVLNSNDIQPGDFFFMGMEYSLKFPGRVYCVTGKVDKGAPQGVGKGGFGYGLGNSYYVIDRSINGGENLDNTRPRPTNKRLVLDYDAASGIEYLYVGTGNGGGVKRSKNEGQPGSWSLLGLSGIIDAITAMALDPTNSNALYVSSVNKVYRITNIRSGTPNVTTLVNAPDSIQELSNIGGSLYAAGKSVYKVTAQGATWTNLQTSSVKFRDGNNPSTWTSVGGRGDTIYAGCQTPVGSHSIAKSTNGGTTWAWVTDPANVSCNIWGRSENWWLCSFEPAVVPGNGGRYETSQIEVDKFNPNIVYSCGKSGVWKSADGGATWRPAVNGLGGSMHTTVQAGSGGSCTVDDVDWDGHTTSDHFYTSSHTYPGAMAAGKLSVTKNSKTYTVVLNAVRDIQLNNMSIADEYFRATCVRPRDIDVSDDGNYIYIAQFGGGVLVGHKSTVSWP